MENSAHCPLLEDCPIYLNNTYHNEMVGLTYRSLYCLQVNKKFKACKRYRACTKLGIEVPRKVLPNTSLSLEEIANYTEVF
jgi:hypothetical protein